MLLQRKNNAVDLAVDLSIYMKFPFNSGAWSVNKILLIKRHTRKKKFQTLIK